MRKLLITIWIATIASTAFAQNSFKAIVLDSLSNESLIGATLVVKGTINGANTNEKGMITLTDIPNGEQTLVVSYVGYQATELIFTFPLNQSEPKKIHLSPSHSDLDEVIIEATRANKSVADLPTRTEVLTEEIDEAASMEAGRIGTSNYTQYRYSSANHIRFI